MVLARYCSEVESTVLRGSHKELCKVLNAPDEFPLLQIPEQNEAIARLCASRLLEPAGGTRTHAATGTLRLTAQPEDVKHYVREHPTPASMFPTGATYRGV